MLEPNPIKAFLRHPERDNDIDVISVIAMCWIAQSTEDAAAAIAIRVINEVGDFQNAARLLLPNEPALLDRIRILGPGPEKRR